MTRRSAIGLLALTPSLQREPSIVLDAADRRAFRAWFTWIAESMAFTPAAKRPREISDCAALLRFSYREALRPHTAEWAAGLGLDWLPPLPELRNPVRKPALFLTQSGSRREFADAENLMRYNSRLLSREIARAAPADLLFYRQLADFEPWHAMVFLGPSAFDNSRESRIVYHTGPPRAEVRRPVLHELLNHPEPRWRPIAGNSNFLGVYRWNILSETD